MKIKVSRSYSAKIQVRQFEPIESFCAAEVEITLPKNSVGAEESILSKNLDDFCCAEVKKTIDDVKLELAREKAKLLPQGKGRMERKEAAKEEAEIGIADFGDGTDEIQEA